MEKNKQHYKLAHNFSRVPVGIKLVTMGQAGETGQRSKGIEFDKYSF